MQAAPCDLYMKIYIYMCVLKADGGAAVVFAPGGGYKMLRIISLNCPSLVLRAKISKKCPTHKTASFRERAAMFHISPHFCILNRTGGDNNGKITQNARNA